MKKKISKKISYKIINEQDLKTIFDYIFSIYSDFDSNSKTFSIKLYSDDSEIYEIQETLNYDELSVLNIKRISKVIVYISDYRLNFRLSLELCQDSDYLTNVLDIESNDENWVNNQFIKMNNIIDSWKPQNRLFSKYKNLLLHFLAINIGLLFIKIINNASIYFGYKSSTTTEGEGIWIFLIRKIITDYPFANYIFIGIVSWLIGWIICVMFWSGLEEKIQKLWPIIEFDFGPEHLKFSKNKRTILMYFFTLVILPILLQILISFN